VKVRHGFVSNSSSSSFQCGVCDEIASGWDVSFEDWGIYQCGICEQTYCEHHALPLTFGNVQRGVEKLIKNSEKSFSNDFHVDQEVLQILQNHSGMLDEHGLDDLQELFEAGTKWSEPMVRNFVATVCCPMCSMQKMSPRLYVKYILKHHLKMTEEEVLASLRGNGVTFEQLMSP